MNRSPALREDPEPEQKKAIRKRFNFKFLKVQNFQNSLDQKVPHVALNTLAKTGLGAGVYIP